MPDVEDAGKDVDLDARGDNGLAVGLDGVVGLLKGIIMAIAPQR